jgi:hypothetical protein
MFFDINYDIAKLNQVDRLKKAEQRRLVKLAKTTQETETQKSQPRRLTISFGITRQSHC